MHAYYPIITKSIISFYTETEQVCLNPLLCISHEECYGGCVNSNGYYLGKNALTDDVPEKYYNQTWVGKQRIFPQKLRISFSCPMLISSVKMRNSGRSSYRNTRNFEIKVRGPNSTQWTAFISGTLANPMYQTQVPLKTFNGTAVIAKEVELSCLNSYSTSSLRCCGLNYIGFE